MQNYYEVLGISSDSSPGEIRKAYHRIALAHHPDKYTPGEVPDHSIEVFRLATEAYEVLRDKESRQKHDLELKQQKAYNSFNRSRSSNSEGLKRPTTAYTGTMPHSYSSTSTYSSWGAAGSPNGAASAASFAFKRSTFSSEYSTGTSRSTRTTTSSTTSTGPGYTSTNSTTSNARPAEYVSSNRTTTGGHPAGYAGTSTTSSNSRPADYFSSNSTTNAHPSGYASSGGSSTNSQPPDHSSFEIPRSDNTVSAGAESGGRMRRPQQTRFSRKSSGEQEKESSEEPHRSEEVVDLTEDVPEEPPREHSPRRRRRSSTDASASKRPRVFDMSSMRFVPPFTEKNGTSLHFEDLTQAMPYPNFHRDAGTTAGSTGSTTSSPQIPNETLQTMLKVIVEATSPPLQKLLQLHSQRAASISLPAISSQAVANNLIDTHQALVELLDYTKQSIDAFNEQCRAGTVPPYS